MFGDLQVISGAERGTQSFWGYNHCSHHRGVNQGLADLKLCECYIPILKCFQSAEEPTQEYTIRILSSGFYGDEGGEVTHIGGQMTTNLLGTSPPNTDRTT
jgi:hypothetical protein